MWHVPLQSKESILVLLLLNLFTSSLLLCWGKYSFLWMGMSLIMYLAQASSQAQSSCRLSGHHSHRRNYHPPQHHDYLKTDKLVMLSNLVLHWLEVLYPPKPRILVYYFCITKHAKLFCSVSSQHLGRVPVVPLFLLQQSSEKGQNQL